MEFGTTAQTLKKQNLTKSSTRQLGSPLVQPMSIANLVKEIGWDIRIVINNVQEKISNKLSIAFDLILDAILYATNVYVQFIINKYV